MQHICKIFLFKPGEESAHADTSARHQLLTPTLLFIDSAAHALMDDMLGFHVLGAFWESNSISGSCNIRFITFSKWWNVVRTFSAVEEEHQLNSRSEAESTRLSWNNCDYFCGKTQPLFALCEKSDNRTLTVLCERTMHWYNSSNNWPKQEKRPPGASALRYQTWLQQEPQCQTKVMTFSFLRQRPEMLCQQLVTQRQRQTFLQHSEKNGVTRTVKTSH